MALFRGLFGKKKVPQIATGPVPFGYKMTWMAVKTGNPADVVACLDLQNNRTVSWNVGIGLAYDDQANVVFVAPPLAGWVLTVGWSVAAIADAEPVKSFYKTTEKMSAQFGEVHAFSTHRITEYSLWMLARNGRVLRSFAYVGESGELLDNFGPLTDVEETLDFFKAPQERWNPGEEDVMTVASGWSLDPTKLTSESGPAEFGAVGRVGWTIE
jgi:hypothetical protein